MMWGILVGGIMFGAIADKCGRKTPLLVAIVLQSITSYVASFLVWYWAFMINWFVLALACGGINIISFVMCMEAVSGKWRTIIPIIFHVPYGLGNVVMAGLAYWLRDWRKLEFALATFSSLYILYYLWIIESPRWLIATGQTEKAIEVIKKIAKENKMEIDVNDCTKLLPQPEHQKCRPGFMAFVKSKNMRMKTMMLSGSWFCTGLAFYTFSQYLGVLGGNIFVTVSVTGLLSTPGGIICIFIISRMGRKTTIWMFQLATAICFILILVMPKDMSEIDLLRLLYAGVGFAGLAGTVPALYLFSGELYPTIGRNVGVGGVTIFARIGSMVAPIIVSLNDIKEDLPLIILAVVSTTQMLFLLPLPETKDSPLPDTLEQAENFKGNTTNFIKSKIKERIMKTKHLNDELLSE